MRIHFDWVWMQMAVGVMYDRRLKTMFFFVGFIMIGIRLKKGKKNEVS